MGHDPYRELEIEPGSSPVDIRQAYLKLARRFHPDQAPAGSESAYEERMKRINAAYEALANVPPSQTKPVQKTPPPGRPTRRQERDPYLALRTAYLIRYRNMSKRTTVKTDPARLAMAFGAPLGMLIGFFVGLPFGVLGCLLGTVTGGLAGAVAGLALLFMIAYAIPAILLAWLGYELGGYPGMVVGGIGGLIVAFLYVVGRSETQKPVEKRADWRQP